MSYYSCFPCISECLEELGHLIQSFGISVCQPTPAAALKIIGQQIGDRDNSVRSSALNACVEAYFLVGETIYKYLSHVSLIIVTNVHNCALVLACKIPRFVV